MSLTPDHDQLILLQRKLEVQRRRLELAKSDGLCFYKPHPKQQEFHAASHKSRRMLCAGNRFGKTEMGAAEDSAWLRGERAWLPENDPLRRANIPQRSVKGLVIAADWDKVDELWTGTDGKIWRFLPDRLVKSKTKNHSGSIDTIVLKNGSSLRFDTVKSFMSNPMGAESSDWDFIHVDEPCPEKLYKAHARGLVDRHGYAWFTLTPLREPWIIDLFQPENPEPNIWYANGTIYDNPYLTPEAIKEFENLLTEEEKDCRLRGIPLHLAGLIYREFDKNVHVLTEVPKGWDSFISPPKDWPVAYWIDPHPQTPHCVSFFTVSPFGQLIQFYDIFSHCPLKELADGIKEIIGSRLVIAARMDPLGFIEDPITQTTMATELAKYGIFVEKATKALAHGIIDVKAKLKQRPVSLAFCPTARRTLWEIVRYSWKEGENKPIDKDDHAMENLYRAVLADLRWVDQSASIPIRDQPIIRTELELERLSYLTV